MGSEKKVRVAINGCGRIGRLILPLIVSDTRYKVVVINGVDATYKAQLEALLKFDSVYGWLGHTVSVEGDFLLYDGQKIKLMNDRGPLESLPWEKLKIDLVVEATGKHTSDARGHMAAGAKKVVLSAPPKKPEAVDTTIVIGANEGSYKPDVHHVVSNASCTTNAVAPVVAALGAEYGVRGGNALTVHAFTQSQNLLDGKGKDTARCRQVSGNIEPTTTGVGKALGLVCPVSITALALRVDAPAGSVIYFDPILLNTYAQPSVEEVNGVLLKAAQRGIIECWQESFAYTSNMVVGNPASVVVDLSKTYYNSALHAFYLLGFYDNEAGFSARLKDLLDLVMDL